MVKYELTWQTLAAPYTISLSAMNDKEAQAEAKSYLQEKEKEAIILGPPQLRRITTEKVSFTFPHRFA